MFGFGKKTKDVRLTEKEIRELKNGMSKRKMVLAVVMIAILCMTCNGLTVEAKITGKASSEKYVSTSSKTKKSSSTKSTTKSSTSKNTSKNTTKKSTSKSKQKSYDTYDDGYDDIYMDGDYDMDRYDNDDDYASGVDDAMDEFGEDW